MVATMRSAVLPLLALIVIAVLLYNASQSLMPDTSSTFTSRKDYTNVGAHLRILPLGDSITEGYGSSDKNGYRLRLRDMLTHAGYTVEYLGTLTDGVNNSSPHHEGWGAHDINQIYDRVASDNILDSKPSLVLLHAGTNDMDRSPASDPYDSAPDRLGRLIDLVFKTNPKTAMLVATIIQNDHTGAQARTNVFNAAIPGVVKARSSQYKIGLVDQKQIGGKDLIDLIHPTDEGYSKMAKNWFAAIHKLPEGWV